MWSLVDLLFPKKCCGCGRLGSYFCPTCLSIMTRRGIKTFNSTQHQGHLSIFRYRGPIKQSLADLKFGFVTDLSNELVDILSHQIVNNYPHLLRHWQEESYVMVPIPLHAYRHRWRGFNQSELIAYKLAQVLNLPYSNTILARYKSTPPQSLIKNRTVRRQLPSGTFSTSSNTPSHLLLFDDVYTSGATTNSAISSLPTSTTVWSLSVAG
jgi:ComF family protein